MFLYVFAVTRAVPLLFMASVMLIGSRFFYDRIEPRGRKLAVSVVVIFIIGCMAVILPYTLRASTLGGMEAASQNNDSEMVLARLDVYRTLGGHDTARTRYLEGLALLHLGRFKEACAPLADSLHGSWQDEVPAALATILLASAEYRSGQWDAAERTLKSVQGDVGKQPLRFYLLGRIDEHQNDRAGAVRDYVASLNADPSYRASFYQLVRITSAAGDRNLAITYMQRFAQLNPAIKSDPFFRKMADDVSHGRPLPDVEFLSVSE